MSREVCFALTRENAANKSFDLLRDTFSLICNTQDWKGPVDCIVPFWMLGIVSEAIKFMTASQPVAHSVPGREDVIRVVAPGYRAGAAGDN